MILLSSCISLFILHRHHSDGLPTGEEFYKRVARSIMMEAEQKQWRQRATSSCIVVKSLCIDEIRNALAAWYTRRRNPKHENIIILKHFFPLKKL